MALLAKKSGMVITCPIPMKRSRVFTRQAMMRESVEKNAAPRTTVKRTHASGSGLQLIFTPRSKRGGR